MIVRLFNYYQQLAEDNLVNAIICNVVPEHGPLVGNIDDDEKFYMKCLGCKYKVYPSDDFLDKMRSVIKQATKDL